MKEIFYKITYKITYKDGRAEEIKTDYKTQHFIDTATGEHKRYYITILEINHNDFIECKKLNWL